MLMQSSHYQVTGDRFVNRHQCSRCSNSFQFAFQLRKHLGSHLIKSPSVYIHDMKVSPDSSAREARVLKERSAIKEDVSLCKPNPELLSYKQHSDGSNRSCESSVINAKTECCVLKRSPVQNIQEETTESLAQGCHRLKRSRAGDKIYGSCLPAILSGGSVSSTKTIVSGNHTAQSSVVSNSAREAVSGNPAVDADSLHHGIQSSQDHAGSLVKRFQDGRQRMVENDGHEKERYEQAADMDITEDYGVSQPNKSQSLGNGTEESLTFSKEGKSSEQRMCHKEMMFSRDTVIQRNSVDLKSAFSITCSISRRDLETKSYLKVGEVTHNLCKELVENTSSSDTIKSVTQESKSSMPDNDKEVLNIQEGNKYSVKEMSSDNYVHSDLGDKSLQQNQLFNNLKDSQDSGMVITNRNDLILQEVSVEKTISPTENVQRDSFLRKETNLHEEPLTSLSLEAATKHRFTCHVCGTTFSKNSGLALHLLAHRRKEIFNTFKDGNQTKTECKSFKQVLKPKLSDAKTPDSKSVKTELHEAKGPSINCTQKVKANDSNAKCSDPNGMLKAKDSGPKYPAESNSEKLKVLCPTKRLLKTKNFTNKGIMMKDSDAESSARELMLKERSNYSSQNGIITKTFVEIKSPIIKEVMKEKMSEKESNTETMMIMTDDSETKPTTTGNEISIQDSEIKCLTKKSVLKAQVYETKLPFMAKASEPNIFHGTGMKGLGKHFTSQCPTLNGVCMAKHSKTEHVSMAKPSIAHCVGKRGAVGPCKLWKNTTDPNKQEMPGILKNNTHNLNKTAKNSISSNPTPLSKLNKTVVECKYSEEKPKVSDRFTLIPCPYCRRYVSKKNISRHRSISCEVLNKPSSKMVNCHVCSKPVMDKNLSSHLEMSHGVGNLRKRSCTVCFMTDFESFNTLQQHKKTHLLDKKDIKLSSDENFDKLLPGCGHLCPICSSVRLSANNIRSHIISHMLENTCIRNQLRRGKKFLCPVCLKAIDLQSRIESHILSHWKIKLFVCPLPACRQEFARFDGLERHCKKYHRNTVDDKSQTCLRMSQQETQEQRSQPQIKNVML